LQRTPQPRATPTDEALAREAAAGVTSAFALLVERHAATVLAVVERMSGDHHLARDLAQEIWIKVHRGLPRFQVERRFRPWLFAIALNHARDERRKAGRRAQRVPLEDVYADLPATVEDPLQRRDERAEIEATLDRVPELYRSAVHLVDVLGLGYEEAARSLECTVGTLKSRVHRGRSAFQEAYLARTRRGAQRESQVNLEAES
jgi:RNA polymerase sigma-70 factor (ECF subfamily)